MSSEIIPPDYSQWLEALKVQITASRSRAALAVNSELIHIYHRIGTEILQRQTTHGWGTKIIQRIASDLKAAFPDMKGFSTRNLNTCAISPNIARWIQWCSSPLHNLGSSLLPNCRGSILSSS